MHGTTLYNREKRIKAIASIIIPGATNQALLSTSPVEEPTGTSPVVTGASPVVESPVAEGATPVVEGDDTPVVERDTPLVEVEEETGPLDDAAPVVELLEAEVVVVVDVAVVVVVVVVGGGVPTMINPPIRE
jgi:hypothetical protein